MSHKPEEHAKWQAETKEKRTGKSKKAKAGSTNPPTLSLSDKIKSILTTTCKISRSDIEEMLNITSLN